MNNKHNLIEASYMKYKIVSLEDNSNISFAHIETGLTTTDKKEIRKTKKKDYIANQVKNLKIDLAHREISLKPMRESTWRAIKEKMEECGAEAITPKGIKERLHMIKEMPMSMIFHYMSLFVLAMITPGIPFNMSEVMSNIAFAKFMEGKSYMNESLKDYYKVMVEVEKSRGDSAIWEIELDSDYLNALFEPSKVKDPVIKAILEDKYSGITYKDGKLLIDYSMDSRKTALFMKYIQKEVAEIDVAISKAVRGNNKEKFEELSLRMGNLQGIVYLINRRDVGTFIGKDSRDLADEWYFDLKSEVKAGINDIVSYLDSNPIRGIEVIEGNILKIDHRLKTIDFEKFSTECLKDKSNIGIDFVKKVMIARKIVNKGSTADYDHINYLNNPNYDIKNRQRVSTERTHTYGAPHNAELKTVKSRMEGYQDTPLELVTLSNSDARSAFEDSSVGSLLECSEIEHRVHVMRTALKKFLPARWLGDSKGNIEKSNNYMQMFFQLADRSGEVDGDELVLDQLVKKFFPADGIRRKNFQVMLNYLKLHWNTDGIKQVTDKHNRKITIEYSPYQRFFDSYDIKDRVSLQKALHEVNQELLSESNDFSFFTEEEIDQFVKLFERGLVIRDQESETAELVRELQFTRGLEPKSKTKLTNILQNRYDLTNAEAAAVVDGLVKSVDEIEDVTEKKLAKDRGNWQFGGFSTKQFKLKEFINIVRYAEVIQHADKRGREACKTETINKLDRTGNLPASVVALYEKNAAAGNGGLTSVIREGMEMYYRREWSKDYCRKMNITNDTRSIPPGSDMDVEIINKAFEDMKKVKALESKHFMSYEQIEAEIDRRVQAGGSFSKLSRLQQYEAIWQENFSKFKTGLTDGGFNEDQGSIIEGLYVSKFRFHMATVRGTILEASRIASNVGKIKGKGLLDKVGDKSKDSLVDELSKKLDEYRKQSQGIQKAVSFDADYLADKLKAQGFDKVKAQQIIDFLVTNEKISVVGDKYVVKGVMGETSFSDIGIPDAEAAVIISKLNATLGADRFIVSLLNMAVDFKGKGNGSQNGYLNYGLVGDRLKEALKQVYMNESEMPESRDNDFIYDLGELIEKPDYDREKILDYKDTPDNINENTQTFKNYKHVIMTYTDLKNMFYNYGLNTSMPKEEIEKRVDAVVNYLSLEAQIHRALMVSLENRFGLDHEVGAELVRYYFQNSTGNYLNEEGKNRILKGDINNLLTKSFVSLSNGIDLTNFLNQYPNKYSYNKDTGELTFIGEMTETEFEELKTSFTSSKDIKALKNPKVDIVEYTKHHLADIYKESTGGFQNAWWDVFGDYVARTIDSPVENQFDTKVSTERYEEYSPMYRIRHIWFELKRQKPDNHNKSYLGTNPIEEMQKVLKFVISRKMGTPTATYHDIFNAYKVKSTQDIIGNKVDTKNYHQVEYPFFTLLGKIVDKMDEKGITSIDPTSLPNEEARRDYRNTINIKFQNIMKEIISETEQSLAKSNLSDKERKELEDDYFNMLLIVSGRETLTDVSQDSARSNSDKDNFFPSDFIKSWLREYKPDERGNIVNSSVVLIQSNQGLVWSQNPVGRGSANDMQDFDRGKANKDSKELHMVHTGCAGFDLLVGDARMDFTKYVVDVQPKADRNMIPMHSSWARTSLATTATTVAVATAIRAVMQWTSLNVAGGTGMTIAENLLTFSAFYKLSPALESFLNDKETKRLLETMSQELDRLIVGCALFTRAESSVEDKKTLVAIFLLLVFLKYGASAFTKKIPDTEMYAIAESALSVVFVVQSPRWDAATAEIIPLMITTQKALVEFGERNNIPEEILDMQGDFIKEEGRNYKYPYYANKMNSAFAFPLFLYAATGISPFQYSGTEFQRLMGKEGAIGLTAAVGLTEYLNLKYNQIRGFHRRKGNDADASDNALARFVAVGQRNTPTVLNTAISKAKAFFISSEPIDFDIRNTVRNVLTQMDVYMNYWGSGTVFDGNTRRHKWFQRNLGAADPITVDKSAVKKVYGDSDVWTRYFKNPEEDKLKFRHIGVTEAKQSLLSREELEAQVKENLKAMNITGVSDLGGLINYMESSKLINKKGLLGNTLELNKEQATKKHGLQEGFVKSQERFVDRLMGDSEFIKQCTSLGLETSEQKQLFAQNLHFYLSKIDNRNVHSLWMAMLKTQHEKGLPANAIHYFENKTSWERRLERFRYLTKNIIQTKQMAGMAAATTFFYLAYKTTLAGIFAGGAVSGVIPGIMLIAATIALVAPDQYLSRIVGNSKNARVFKKWATVTLFALAAFASAQATLGIALAFFAARMLLENHKGPRGVVKDRYIGVASANESEVKKLTTDNATLFKE